jgi:hypothetical protein
LPRLPVDWKAAVVMNGTKPPPQHYRCDTLRDVIRCETVDKVRRVMRNEFELHAAEILLRRQQGRSQQGLPSKASGNYPCQLAVRCQ